MKRDFLRVFLSLVLSGVFFFTVCIEVYSQGTQSPQTFDSVLEEGCALYLQGEWNLALGKFKEANNLAQGKVQKADAAFWLAAAYHTIGDLEMCEINLRILFVLDPDRVIDKSLLSHKFSEWIEKVKAEIPGIPDGDMNQNKKAESDENVPEVIAVDEEPSVPIEKTKETVKKKKKFPLIPIILAVVAGGAVALFLLTKKKKQASLAVKTPSQIPCSRIDSENNYYWDFRYEISETGGVGVTLFTWISTFYDAQGKYIGTSVNDINDFGRWFTECGGSGIRIEANSTRCCDPFYWKWTVSWWGPLSSFPWTVSDTMSFADDFGNGIDVKAKFILLPPGWMNSLPEMKHLLTESFIRRNDVKNK